MKLRRYIYYSIYGVMAFAIIFSYGVAKKNPLVVSFIVSFVIGALVFGCFWLVGWAQRNYDQKVKEARENPAQKEAETKKEADKALAEAEWQAEARKKVKQEVENTEFWS